MLPELPDITDDALSARLRQRLDDLTKPPGSLGRLEDVAHRIGCILGTEVPALHQPQLVVFAADHGLTAHGVSAWPAEVTAQMVENMLAGGAAVSVLARLHGLTLTVADCGVGRDLLPRPGLVVCKSARGSADALNGPAMTPQQCAGQIAAGAALVRTLPGNALLLGEMGIGNSAAAALLMSGLTGLDIAACTGPGAGLDADGVARKVAVLRRVQARHADARTPLDMLAAYGGLEIATMTGAVLQAAAERRVIVVDGFICTAAVAVAAALRPHVLQRCIWSHRGAEPGHAAWLRHLGAEPLLELGLRLGEGSGAALCWPLLQSACALLSQMARFSTTDVSRRSPSGAAGA